MIWRKGKVPPRPLLFLPEHGLCDFERQKVVRLVLVLASTPDFHDCLPDFFQALTKQSADLDHAVVTARGVSGKVRAENKIAERFSHKLVAIIGLFAGIGLQGDFDINNSF